MNRFAAFLIAAGSVLALGSLTASAGDYDPAPQPDVTVTVAPTQPSENPTAPSGNPTAPSGNPTQPPGGGGPGSEATSTVPQQGTPTSTVVAGTATPSGTATLSGTSTPAGGSANNSLARASGDPSGTGASGQSGVTTGVSGLPSAGAGPAGRGSLLFASGAVLMLLGAAMGLRGRSLRG